MHKDHPTRQFDKTAMEGWCCTESFDVHRDVLQPKLKKYIDPSRIVDQSFVKKNTWGNIKYKADDGTISDISFKSYDQGRRMFQGAGKKFIWFDEEPPRDIWEECTVREEGARQIVNGQWVEKSEANLLNIFLTMTPVNGMTWVHDELYLATNNPDIKVVVASWMDNPWLSQEQIDRMSRGLTAEALQVRREGKFVRMTGLVCPWFDRSIHIQPIVFDPSWTLYRAIDFGFSNPCCVIWVGVDYDDNWYIYDGIYQTGLTNQQLKDAIVRKDAQRYIANCWGDSAAVSDIAELNQMGVLVLPVEKVPGDSKESWDEYRARILMEQGRVGRDGKTKIIISSSLTRFDPKLGREVNWALSEAEKLKWDEKKVDGVVEQKSRWGHQPNHFVDALSYFAHEYRKIHGFSEPNNMVRVNDDVPTGYTPVDSFQQQGYDAFDV